MTTKTNSVTRVKYSRIICDPLVLWILNKNVVKLLKSQDLEIFLVIETSGPGKAYGRRRRGRHRNRSLLGPYWRRCQHFIPRPLLGLEPQLSEDLRISRDFHKIPRTLHKKHLGLERYMEGFPGVRTETVVS